MALKDEHGENVNFIIADLDEQEAQIMAQKFNVTSIPVFFFIDAEGNIVSEISGEPSYNELDSRISALLTGSTIEETGLNKFFNVTIPEAMEEGLLITVVFVFIGGVVTSISPCILAMVPILVGYIGGYSKPSKIRGFTLSLLFVLGLSTTFAILGVFAALLGKVFGQVGPTFYYIIAAAAVIMGLNLLGVIKINMPGLKSLPFTKEGYLGAYLTGLFFGLVASPCATPVLAVVMAYVATQGDLAFGAGLLFIYGLGHGLPLLIVGTFTAALKKLDKFQKWSTYVTYFSGAILILLGLYFLLIGLR